MRYFFPILKIVAGITVFMGVLMVSHAVSQRFNSVSSTETQSGESGAEQQASSPVAALIVEGESIDRLAEKLKMAGQEVDYEPGEKAFVQACELLSSNFFFEAEEKLKELVVKYPYAPSVYEARRILGQINIDRYLSDEKIGGKKLYKVKPGDSFYKVARENETSIGNMMLINGLQEIGKLHVGEDLLVMPLHFNLVVDIPNRRLILEYGKSFVKDYPFKKLISTQGKGRRKTVVESVMALSDGREVRVVSDAYRGADKLVQIGHPGMEIVGDDFAVDDAFQGIILERPQIEELAVILRRGNLVEIRY